MRLVLGSTNYAPPALPLQVVMYIVRILKVQLNSMQFRRLSVTSGIRIISKLPVLEIF